MRTAALILMIALLPLRLWAADDMAIRMAGQGGGTAVAMAAEPMPPGCPMLAHAGDSDQDPANPPSHCTACHLCAASAIFQHVSVERVRAVEAPPREGCLRFVSALPSLDHKPPIS